MEKGLGAMGTPRAWSMAKLSRAEWPMARIRRSQGSVYVPAGPCTRAAVSTPFSISRPSRRLAKRISPPRDRISSRIERTTPTSTSVPTWGLAS